MGFFSKIFRSKSSHYGESLSEIVKKEVGKYDERSVNREMKKFENKKWNFDPVSYKESILVLFTLIGFYFTNSRSDVNFSEASDVFLSKTASQVVEGGSVGWSAMLSSNEPEKTASKQAAERYFGSEPSQEQIEHFREHAQSFFEVIESFDKTFG